MNRRDFLIFSQLSLLSTLSASYKKESVFSDSYVKDFISIVSTSSYDSEAKSINQIAEKDIFLSSQKFLNAKTLFKRLRAVQRIVGYGNFNVISFDEALLIGRNYSKVGKFTSAELSIFEELFNTKASEYGFYGEKVLQNMTRTIPKKSIIKIPKTGHYLFREKSQELYSRVHKEVGGNIILTSGIRGVVKQMYLFLNKAIILKGNLTKASFSLAPAGYSFHGVGDFDVGKVGFGRKNFTASFATTDEYKRLMDLGYISIRYPHQNPFGVRYEPWHIKVT